MSVRSIVPSSAASKRSTTGAGATLRRVARALPWRRCWASISPSLALEVPVAFPVGNGGLEGVDLHARHIQIVLDYFFPEATPGRLAGRKKFPCFAQVCRYVWLVRFVGVADELLFEGELVLHAMEACGDHSGYRQVRVDVPTRQPVLDAQGVAVADDAQATGAVVPTPRDCSRGEGAFGIALVRVYVRGEEERELAQAGDLAREEVVEGVRKTVVFGEDGCAVLRAQAQVYVAGVALAFVELRHKGDGAALLGGDLLGAVLVDGVPVRGGQSVVEPEVDLVLPEVALALRIFNRETSPRHRVADAPEQRLDARRSKQRVVDVVVVGGLQISVPFTPRFLVGVHEDDELEFGPYEGFEATFGEPP